MYWIPILGLTWSNSKRYHLAVSPVQGQIVNATVDGASLDRCVVVNRSVTIDGSSVVDREHVVIRTLALGRGVGLRLGIIILF